MTLTHTHTYKDLGHCSPLCRLSSECLSLPLRLSLFVCSSYSHTLSLPLRLSLFACSSCSHTHTHSALRLSLFVCSSCSHTHSVAYVLSLFACTSCSHTHTRCLAPQSLCVTHSALRLGSFFASSSASVPSLASIMLCSLTHSSGVPPSLISVHDCLVCVLVRTHSRDAPLVSLSVSGSRL